MVNFSFILSYKHDMQKEVSLSCLKYILGAILGDTVSAFWIQEFTKVVDDLCFGWHLPFAFSPGLTLFLFLF